jgi:hypothetical protein
MNFILIFIFSITTTISFAKEDIPIITRNSLSSPSFITSNILVKKLNNMQPTYNFILHSVPGSNGESADQRALSLARNKVKVLWNGPIASFTINRYQFNTYDRDSSFYFIKSFSSTYQSLVTNPEDTSNSLNDYFLRLKNRDKIFYGLTMEVGSSQYLTNIILKHFNINNAKDIKYKDFAEISLALRNREVDFSIYIQPGIGNLKELLNSGNDANSGLQNNIKDFYYESNSSFAVPTELKDFGLELKKYFDQLCDDTEIIESLEKIKYKRTCFDDDVMRQKIKKELELIEKYK